MDLVVDAREPNELCFQLQSATGAEKMNLAFLILILAFLSEVKMYTDFGVRGFFFLEEM